MNRNILFPLWGICFVLCAGLGFLPEPQGAWQWVSTACSLLFFLPPAVLLWKGEKKEAMLVRNLAGLSLGITTVTLMLNFVLAVGSETLGGFLHCILVVVSAPMIASGHWALSLFLWACLLMVGLKKSK